MTEPSELQLKGRATPALASLDRTGCVIHIGSFSKTISPTLRLGFLVAPLPLASRFAEVAACLAPPPGPSVQLAIAEFLREGHYMRHLRRTKRVYAAQRDALIKHLRPRAQDVAIAGLAALLPLPDGALDQAIAAEMLAFGLAPAPLSSATGLPGSQRHPYELPVTIVLKDEGVTNPGTITIEHGLDEQPIVRFAGRDTDRAGRRSRSLPC